MNRKVRPIIAVCPYCMPVAAIGGAIVISKVCDEHAAQLKDIWKKS